MYITKEAVQGVSKLMEDRLRLVCGQQGRLSLSRLTKVEYGRDNRRHTLAIFVGLRAIATTPSATTLTRTGEEVHIEHAQCRAILVLALECERIGIGLRNI